MDGKENRYCAFLRGVNVKGTSMKMAEVCDVFSNAGMKNVVSVLASGNIIFSSEKNAVELRIELEKAISAHFNYEGFLFILNKNEIREIAVNCPFEKDENFHIYVFVGTEKIDKLLRDEFENSVKSEDQDGKITNGFFYWKVPNGNSLDSSFGKILGRKNLKNHFTSRNINTFEKVINNI